MPNETNNYIKTADPNVVITKIESNVKYYKELSTGREWKVTGRCDKRGFCMLGATVCGPNGELVRIESVEHLNKLAKEWNREGHIQTDEPLDVPTGPAYKGDCCPLKVEVLK
jgi:hypothetical protein